MKFKVFGHRNLLGTHKTTLEFTKDKELSKRGDCVIGVNSDFSDIKDILKFKKVKVKVKIDDLSDELTCDINSDFNDKREIVIRKSDFRSERTLGINADKAAIDIDRRIIEKLKDPNKRMDISIINY
jgi:hypothetical protein